MIANWNAIVGKEDFVYHLGDFALGEKKNVQIITKQLNGNIVLIRGNHDRSKKWLKEQGFYAVYNELKIGNYFLTHRPRIHKLPKGFVNLHGHCHGNPTKLDKEIYKDFSCENTDYKPFEFSFDKT